MQPKRLMSVLLSMLLAFPAPFWSSAALAIISEEADSALSEKLTRSERFAAELRQAINRSVFDLEARLVDLDYDHAEIIRFVREEIAFEQYRGALRGPLGALIGQAGNSLDQAVLLAKLLRDAGYDARIARGTLNESDARSLLRQMSQPRPAPKALGNVAGGIATLKSFGLLATLDEAQTRKLVEMVERPPTITDTAEFESFRSTTGQVQKAFDALAADAADELDSTLLKEAQDYFWVEAKTGAADTWLAIHPALPNDSSVSPERTGTFADSIPAELQHRVRLQMFIERTAGGKKTTTAVTEAWERPVPNLVGLPVVFAVLPDSALDPANSVLSPKEIIGKANYFVPMLLNGPAPGAQYFDGAGNLIDPMAAGNVAAGVVKQVGRGFGDALGAIGDESNVPRLGAVWIDITLISPGGEETRYRRLLTGDDGSAGMSEQAGVDAHLDSLLPLLRTNTLMISAGRTPRGMAIDAQLAQWQRTVPGLKALAWGVEDNSALSQSDKASLNEVPANWLGHLSLMSRFDLVDDWSASHRLYRHEPLVAIHTVGVGDATGGMARVDIVHNARRAFDVSGSHPRSDPRAQVAAGVWETLNEGALLEPGRRVGAMKVLQAASEQGIALRSIKPGDALEGLPLAADARRHLEADLERGYAVLVPERLPAGHERTAWWRVDPRTGETLGLLDDGRGVELSEAVSVTIAIAGLGFLHYSLYGCFSQAYGAKGSNVDFQLMCCVLFNYGAMLVMSVLSAVVALKIADGAADMIGMSVDVLDFGMGFDGMVCDAIIN